MDHMVSAIMPQPATVIHGFCSKPHIGIRMGRWRHAINIPLRRHEFLISAFIMRPIAWAAHLLFPNRDDFPPKGGGCLKEVILALDGEHVQLQLGLTFVHPHGPLMAASHWFHSPCWLEVNPLFGYYYFYYYTTALSSLYRRIWRCWNTKILAVYIPLSVSTIRSIL